nr:hypothetical protein [Oscillospiraceae bacterium]
MAGIIVSENSNVVNSLFGELQAPLKSLLERENELWMNKEGNIVEKIFVNFPITTHSATIGGLLGSNGFAPVGENGAYPTAGIEEGYFQTFIPETWKGSFMISMEMMEDKLSAVMKGQPIAFLDDYYRARHNFFWGLLGAALQNKDALVLNGKSFSVKGKDGSRVFSTAHKIKRTGKTQSNAFANSFSQTDLGKVATAMQNLKTDGGELANVQPNTIIIPNLEAAKAEVFGVLGAYHDANTAAGNKYNYQFGNWNVAVSPYLNQYVDETAESFPWILADLEYNKRYYGAVDVDRKPLTVRSTIAENDANVWKGNARFTGAFHDFRAFAVGGVSWGSEV